MIKLMNKTINQELVLSYSNFDYVLESVDWGEVESSVKGTVYMDQIGEEVMNTNLRPRDIFIVGWVVANSEIQMKQRKNFLNKLVNPLYDLDIVYGEYLLKTKPDNSIKYGKTEQENNEILCRFSINATAYMPLFTYKNYEVVTESKPFPLLKFPLISPIGKGFAFGKIPAVDIGNLINLGDVPAGFVAKLIASGGTVVNPKLLNLDTGEYIEVKCTLQKDEILVLSTIMGDKYVKKISGTLQLDMINYLANGSSLFQLNVGINHLELQAEQNAGNLTTETIYSPRFLEVQ